MTKLEPSAGGSTAPYEMSAPYYDAIVCPFSSIAYSQTVVRLADSLANLAAEL